MTFQPGQTTGAGSRSNSAKKPELLLSLQSPGLSADPAATSPPSCSGSLL